MGESFNSNCTRTKTNSKKMFTRGSTQMVQRLLFHRAFTTISPLTPKPQPVRTLLQCGAIALVTVGCYVTYNVNKGKPCFLPYWVSKSKRVPSEREVDLKYVKVVAEEQILERLSLNGQIKEEFRLPIKTRLHDDFKVWTEEKNVSVKGVEVRPGFKWNFVKKPVNVKADFEVLMENLGGDERFDIPVINSNKLKDEDVWFLGTVTIEGRNKQTADVVFKGIFDAEHAKQARVLNAHLVKVVDGKKVRERLWDN